MVLLDIDSVNLVSETLVRKEKVMLCFVASDKTQNVHEDFLWLQFRGRTDVGLFKKTQKTKEDRKIIVIHNSSIIFPAVSLLQECIKCSKGFIISTIHQGVHAGFHQNGPKPFSAGAQETVQQCYYNKLE